MRYGLAEYTRQQKVGAKLRLRFVSGRVWCFDSVEWRFDWISDDATGAASGSSAKGFHVEF